MAQIAAIERSRTEPGALASEALQANLSPYPRSNIRHSRTMDEQIEDMKKVTLEDVKAFIVSFMVRPPVRLSSLGNSVPRMSERLPMKLWVAGRVRARMSDCDNRADRNPDQSEDRNPDKENAQFNAGLRIPMSDTDPDYAAMVVANFMFGGSISARLPDRVRNREGLSYSVGTSFSAQPLEMQRSFCFGHLQPQRMHQRWRRAFVMS
jgi:zinc protease